MADPFKRFYSSVVVGLFVVLMVLLTINVMS